MLLHLLQVTLEGEVVPDRRSKYKLLSIKLENLSILFKLQNSVRSTRVCVLPVTSVALCTQFSNVYFAHLWIYVSKSSPCSDQPSPARTDKAMPFNSSPCMGAGAQMRQGGLCAPVGPGGEPSHQCAYHTFVIPNAPSV